MQFIKRRSSVSKTGYGLASRLRFLGENWSFCQEISFWEDFVDVRLSWECRWIGKLWVCQLSSNFDIEPKKVLHPHSQSVDIYQNIHTVARWYICYQNINTASWYLIKYLHPTNVFSSNTQFCRKVISSTKMSTLLPSGDIYPNINTQWLFMLWL